MINTILTMGRFNRAILLIIVICFISLIFVIKETGFTIGNVLLTIVAIVLCGNVLTILF